MYIRKATQKNQQTGKTYSTYRLVESYRNAKGQVRQQVLMNLGSHFNVAKAEWKLLADRIEDICHGQQSFFPPERELECEAQRIAKIVLKKYSELQEAKNTCQENNTSSHAQDYQTVDINSMAHQDIRKVGAEHLGVHAASQLQLKKILRQVGFNQKQINIALANIIGRLVRPGSELSTHRYLTQQSALDELLHTDFSKLLLKNFYQISDQIFEFKEEIESRLYQREKDFFNLEEIVTLYDLTNTYFEGSCLANRKAQYGHSKEKRNDCRIVALGLVLDSSGFPKRSEMFEGNISEPKTLQGMLEKITTMKKVTVVMDAGIATEENVAWLKSQDYDYVVVKRAANKEIFDEEKSIVVKEKDGNIVKSFLVKNEETEELELYCHSTAKEEKEKALQNKPIKRYQESIEKLKAGLDKKGGTKKYEKILERLGRLKEKFSKVSKCFEIKVEKNKNDENTKSITWKRVAEFQRKPGIYCLRTNRKDLDETTFWNIYVMLTDIEAAFRHLKSELGFRPIYHQKEKRVDGHLFISILAYHLLHTLRYQLKHKGINSSWKILREILSTQCRITTTLQLKNKKTVNVRKTTSPDTE